MFEGADFDFADLGEELQGDVDARHFETSAHRGVVEALSDHAAETRAGDAPLRRYGEEGGQRGPMSGPEAGGRACRQRDTEKRRILCQLVTGWARQAAVRPGPPRPSQFPEAALVTAIT